MIYGSVCSGIEAATVAWHGLEWKPAWFSEIEPFPSKLLNHHYPQVPNLGDMTKLNEHEHYCNTAIDLLVGGTPCQSFSIAGLRGGMGDDRGNLALEYCRILIAKRPKWFVWENVPGVFSSFTDEAAGAPDFHSELEPGDEWCRDITETADFATLLTAFRECGYSVAWRVLDSQHFGVPQRRRRVFVVGHLGDDWRPPAAVLFESEGMYRDFTPSREKGKGITSVASFSAGNSSEARGIGYTKDGTPPLRASASGTNQVPTIVATLDASYGHTQGASGQDLNHGHSHLVIGNIDCENNGHLGDDVTGPLMKGSPSGGGRPLPAVVVVHGTQDPCVTIDSAHTLGRNRGQENAVCYHIHGTDKTASVATESDVHSALRSRAPGGIENSTTSVIVQAKVFVQNERDEVRYMGGDGQLTGALSAQAGMKQQPYLHDGPIVRRLTPLECERLQGFPDGYSDIPGASDTARYAAIGNSMTTHVMKWIGERIQMVDNILNKLR